MADEKSRTTSRRDGDPRRGGDQRGKRRETINIQFARGLSSQHLNLIMQLELLRARSQKPPATEASLPVEVFHDVKFRLRYYATKFGEIDRKKFFEDADEGTDRDEG